MNNLVMRSGDGKLECAAAVSCFRCERVMSFFVYAQEDNTNEDSRAHK
jgi:hypothetical protein